MNNINNLELAKECVLRLNNLIENPTIKNDILKLLKTKVQASLETITHSTLQVSNDNKLGCLGLLNGICGIEENQHGFIAMEIDEVTGELIKFIILE